MEINVTHRSYILGTLNEKGLNMLLRLRHSRELLPTEIGFPYSYDLVRTDGRHVEDQAQSIGKLNSSRESLEKNIFGTIPEELANDARKALDDFYSLLTRQFTASQPDDPSQKPTSQGPAQEHSL